MRHRFARPDPCLNALELPRSVGEMHAFVYVIAQLRALPAGDGHRVLVLPGFTGDDASTAALRWFLIDRGYRATPWRLGRNLGPTDLIIDGLQSLMERVVAARERVSIVGWSLGGIFARELGRAYPEAVRSVITLGSPFRLGDGDRDESYATSTYDALSELHSERAKGPHVPEDARPPMPVPVTNIYSRTDGVAPWRGCIDIRGGWCDNVEVPGSHSGLGHNPLALVVIADRLAQPDDTWQPYQVPLGLTSVIRVGPKPSPTIPSRGLQLAARPG
jgi:pimeloyl-ACP methyl ester carboxylesterase